MKFPQNIVLPLLGLLFIGAATFSFPGVARASCIAAGTRAWGAGCSVYLNLNVADGSSFSITNTAGGYTGYENWSCSNSTFIGPSASVCNANCSAVGTHTWGTGCSTYINTTVADGATVTNINTAAGYSGSDSYTCSNGAWLLQYASCSAIVYAPTSASISSAPGTVTPNQTFAISWSGNNSPTYYNAMIGSLYYAGLTVTASGNLTAAGIPLATGNYLLQVQACNSAGCSGWFPGNTLVVQPPAPTFASISANPNPVTLNKPTTISWSGNNTPTSYTVFIDSISIPQGSATSWTGTPASLPLAVGTHTMSVQACNSSGCMTSGNSSLVVNPAVPTISSFTASNTALPASGGPVTLSWSASGVTSCTVTGGGRNDMGLSPVGSETFTVTTNATYNITCQ